MPSLCFCPGPERDILVIQRLFRTSVADFGRLSGASSMRQVQPTSAVGPICVRPGSITRFMGVGAIVSGYAAAPAACARVAHDTPAIVSSTTAPSVMAILPLRLVQHI